MMKGIVDKKYCKNCVYYTNIFGADYCCSYMLDTGKRRPCPAGVGCTEKLVRKKKKVNIAVSKKRLKKSETGGE